MRCDICSSEFRITENVRSISSRPRHYCSFACAVISFKKDGPAGLARRATCLEKFGCEYPIIRPDVLAENTKKSQSPEANAKRLATLRENRKDTYVTLSRGLTLIRSKAEVEFFNVLESTFNVKATCPKYVNHWFIDGWVESHDVYVQFDGVYWHSRPERILVDREQDDWFEAQGLTLIRVTDVDWKKCRTSVLEKLNSLFNA